MSISSVAVIAPLGSGSSSEEGAVRRARFAASWTRTKRLAAALRENFTLENLAYATSGAAVMILSKSAACALASSCALPALGVAAASIAAGAVTAGLFSYAKSSVQAYRRGEAHDSFFSRTNLDRMAIAAGFAALGGSAVAAYVNGYLEPVEKIFGHALNAAGEFLMPSAHAFDYSHGSWESEWQNSSREPVVLTALAPAPVPVAEVASQAVVTEAVSPVSYNPVPEPVSSPVPSEPVVEASAPIPDTSIAGQTRAYLLTQGQTLSPRIDALLTRAETNPQALKDFAILTLWGKSGLTANPELARALLEESVNRGNGQALRDLTWMDKNMPHVKALSLASPVVPDSLSPSLPTVVASDPVVSAPEPEPLAWVDQPLNLAQGEVIRCQIELPQDNGKQNFTCTAHAKEMIEDGEYMTVKSEEIPDVELVFKHVGHPKIQGFHIHDIMASGFEDIRKTFRDVSARVELYKDQMLGRGRQANLSGKPFRGFNNS